MKKFFIAIFSVISFCTTNAQELEKGLLWKVSGNGLEMPSYVFGTIHATCNATLSPEVLKALDNTTQLYLEIDMDSKTLTADMMKGVAMKGGRKISEMVSADEFKSLDAFLKDNIGLGMTILDTYKPLIIESLLLPKMLNCEIQSYELELVKHSQQQQEEILGLETVQEQLTVFDNIPYEEQVKSLLKMSADGLSGSTTQLKSLIVLYESQDLNKLYAYMTNETDPVYFDHNDILLTNRNINWIPKIEAVAKKQPTLFAVGAGHLAGEQGVIMLLRKKGYTVEPVVAK
ncbi:hypothetical protein AM493_07565 [Flavobacterium akiainvivens]|uniref:Polysaccharide biosynthesis protein GumN n=1 Tax=Flavobacterium akiainvivens TaxID=1202724 RepID=A0A0M8MHV7_9FLAO|nr:TraB/GumN family protein [Flavobacterium akiainvivens]KOS05908.1 hypothetical protein AM493_07565 [Flavobacterium akiainvivens]SFQ55949.1 hypothetical protein SAMN05444144_1085 [Flavobacterium akiainvivens]